MKNSREIADYVFKARDKYLEKKKKRKLIIGRITSFGTLGATVATVLICAFNLLPILEDNEIDVLPPSVNIEYSTEYTEPTTETTVSQLPDSHSENETNTDNTDPTEPVQTNVAIITKPVLTTAVSGMQNPSQATQAVVTKPVMTSIVMVTQTGPNGVILEDFVTSIVTVTEPSVSTNANITKPVITTAIAPSLPIDTTLTKPSLTTTAGVTKPQLTTVSVIVTAPTPTETNSSIQTTVSFSIGDAIYPGTTTAVTTTDDIETATNPTVSKSVSVSRSQSISISQAVSVSASVSRSLSVSQSVSVHVSVSVSVSESETVTTTITWNDSEVKEQFSTITVSGENYDLSDYIVDSSTIQSLLGYYTISAINPQSGELCYITVKVYTITGLDLQTTIAVKFNGNDNYYVYEKSP